MLSKNAISAASKGVSTISRVKPPSCAKPKAVLAEDGCGMGLLNSRCVVDEFRWLAFS